MQRTKQEIRSSQRVIRQSGKRHGHSFLVRYRQRFGARRVDTGVTVLFIFIPALMFYRDEKWMGGPFGGEFFFLVAPNLLGRSFFFISLIFFI